MPRVLLLTRYERLGASSRVRFLQFIPALERTGFEIDVRPLLDNDYVRSLYGGPPPSRWRVFAGYLRRLAGLFAALAGHRHDVVWLEKEALPYLPAFIETTLLARVPYVVDLDDAWFHRYEAHPSPLVRALLRGKIDAVMRNAAIVVAGNDYLAARARKAGARRIEIIPTAIDLARYPDPAATAENRAAVVGWIGIPLNAHYLNLVEPALRRARDIKLHVVGAPVPPEFAGIPAESFAWSEQTEVARICDFDIGIMPLADTPWERGKCAYKLLQVMAAGKPVIASPVGANCQVVQHGVNGFLAATQDEWVDALRTLAADAALRARMGAEARRTVAGDYSAATVGQRLAAVLTEAAKPRR